MISEKDVRIVALESEITVINEELTKATAKNRGGLIKHYSSKLYDLFLDLQDLRRLTFKEKLGLRLLKMYASKQSRKTTKRLKKARANVINNKDELLKKGVVVVSDADLKD